MFRMASNPATRAGKFLNGQDDISYVKHAKRNDDAPVASSNPFASASSLKSKTITPDELKIVSSELRAAVVPNEDGVLMVLGNPVLETHRNVQPYCFAGSGCREVRPRRF